MQNGREMLGVQKPTSMENTALARPIDVRVAHKEHMSRVPPISGPVLFYTTSYNNNLLFARTVLLLIVEHCTSFHTVQAKRNTSSWNGDGAHTLAILCV